MCKKIPVDLYQCGKCYNTAYCSEECQVKDWKSGHRVVCQKESSSSSSWNSKLMDYAKDMELLIKGLKFPSKAKSVQEMVSKLDKQGAALDSAIKRTKALSYSMMKKKGASQEQMDYIEEEMDSFQRALFPVVNSALRGKNDISLDAVIKLQGHLDSAQKTLEVVKGGGATKQDEEKAYSDELVKMVSRAGQILAKSLLSSSSSLPIIVESPIPKLIGTNFGDMLKSIPPYAAGKASNLLGDFLRDIIYCLGSTKDRTYSAEIRTLSSNDVRDEHARAREHIMTNSFLGSLALKAVDMLDKAKENFERAALGGSDEALEKYEEKRQTASMLFSIATATALGIYSVFCYTKMEDFKKEKIAELDRLAKTRDDQKLTAQQLEELKEVWEARKEEFANQAKGSMEKMRQIEKRQLFLGFVDKTDIAFEKLLKSVLTTKSGCNVFTEESSALEESAVGSGNLLNIADLNEDVKRAIYKNYVVDQISTSQSLDPGVLNDLSEPLLSQYGRDVVIDERKCDPAKVMPAFQNVFTTMFAMAESSIKSAPKLPEVEQVFFDESQRGSLEYLESQKQLLLKTVDVVNTSSEWAEKQPAAAAAALRTLNRVNPLLGQSFIGAVQKVQEEQKAQVEIEKVEFERLYTGAAWMKNITMQDGTNVNELVKGSEAHMKKMAEEISEIQIPQDPVNFAFGNIVWIINKAFTLGLSSQKQFAGAFIPSISSTYQAMLAMWSNVSTKEWGLLFSSLSNFIAKLTVFLWWMDVGLVGLAAVSVGALLLGAPVLTLLRKLATIFGNLFVASAPVELKKMRKTKFAKDEGSSLHASWIEWIFGGVSTLFDGLTFGIGGFFNGLVLGSGAITLASLMIGLYASSLNALANVVTTAVTVGWPAVGVAITNVVQLYTGYILLTPLIRFVTRKTDYDQFYCFRKLLLVASGAINMVALSEVWNVPYWWSPWSGASYVDITPSWEILVWLMWFSWKGGRWLASLPGKAFN